MAAIGRTLKTYWAEARTWTWKGWVGGGTMLISTNAAVMYIVLEGAKWNMQKRENEDRTDAY